MTAPRSFDWDVTSEHHPGARDEYRDGFEGLYEVDDVDLGHGGIFFNRTRMTLFGSGVIGRGRSNTQVLRRAPQLVRRAGFDTLSVVLANSPISGTAGERSYSCPAGSLIFADHGRPSTSRWQDLDLINLVVPREAVPPGLARMDIHGLTLAPGNPAGRLLASHLRTLSDVAPELGDAEGEAAIGAAMMIAQRALGGSPSGCELHRESVYRTVRETASRFLDSRLLDPGLSVERIARACAVSRATLYRAFDDRGGLMRYVQRQRLALAREALASRVRGRPTIADIACEHGFASPTHFSRAFRDLFGLSPSDVPPRHRGAPRGRRASPIRLGAVVDWMKKTASG